MRHSLGPLSLIVSLSFFGCQSQQDDWTAVMVQMDADVEIKRAMRALALRIAHLDGASWRGVIDRAWEVDTRFEWPAELPIVPDGEQLRLFEVVVEARGADGRMIAGTRAVTSFDAAQVTTLAMFLEAACMARGEECESEPECVGSNCQPCRGPDCTTCRGGECVAAGLSPVGAYPAAQSVREAFTRTTSDTKPR
jgi:hypothetical protein